MTPTADVSFGDATHRVSIHGNNRSITAHATHVLAIYGEVPDKLGVLLQSTTASKAVFSMLKTPSIEAGADNVAFTLVPVIGSANKTMTIPFFSMDDHPVAIDVSQMNGWTIVFTDGLFGAQFTFSGPTTVGNNVTIKGLDLATKSVASGFVAFS